MSPFNMCMILCVEDMSVEVRMERNFGDTIGIHVIATMEVDHDEVFENLGKTHHLDEVVEVLFSHCSHDQRRRRLHQ